MSTAYRNGVEVIGVADGCAFGAEDARLGGRPGNVPFKVQATGELEVKATTVTE